MKKKILSMILTLIAIVSFGTIALAEHLPPDGTGLNYLYNMGESAVGNTIRIRYSSLLDRNDLYCIQRGSPLRGDGNLYTVARYIRIYGNQSVDELGRGVVSTLNGQLAYILHYGYDKQLGRGEGYGSQNSNSHDDYYTATQRALYSTLNLWYSNVGYIYGVNCSKSENGNAPQTTESVNVSKGASDYANRLNNNSNGVAPSATDNTNRAGITTTQNNGYVRVGPFNWSYTGTIKSIEVLNQNNSSISNVRFSKFSGNTEQFYNSVSDIQSGENFYISVPSNSGTTTIGKLKPTIKNNGSSSETNIRTAQIWYLKSAEAGQDLILATAGKEEVTPNEIETPFEFSYNVPITRDLTIVKVDSRNQNIRLANVGFKIKNRDTNKYVRKINQQISYVDNENDATTFRTNSNGEISLTGLVMGTYLAYETQVPDYQYKRIEGSIEIAPSEPRKVIPNEQVYVKVSGYVWKDNHSGKTTIRNNLYKTSTNTYTDDKDEAVNGIIVKLILSEGSSDDTADTKRTSELGLYPEINGGEYQFERVEIAKLEKYYIEFQYDGLIYQSAVVNLSQNSGSKATDRTERAILDSNFASVNATGENRVDVRDANSNNRYSITYNDTVNHMASIENTDACILNANTKDAGYNIAAQYSAGVKEIKYVNLGIYERPQLDLALTQDVKNVKVGVNGYWHVYNYESRSYQGEYNPNDPNTWNLGVRFKNSYTGTYFRAIYKSDLDYEKPDDRNKELQVYLTYKIGFVNESSYLARVNKIVDYFDNRYTITAVGTSLDEQENIRGNLNYSNPEAYNNKYQKINIDVNSTIESGKIKDIYVQFKLERAAILQIMNSKETLSNRAEITSYTTFKSHSSNTIAAIDIDSVPGNTKIENKNTFEDDTDAAPPVLLELTDARKIQGTVFVDGTTGELKTGEIRQGNGIFDNGETTLSGVKVTLHEVNNANSDIVVDTDSNGNYELSGYIPGQYTITYTWGDKTYTVQSYKGTIYDKTRRQNNLNWYKDKVDTRETDAIDDYPTRLEIDKEMVAISDNTLNNKIADLYNGGNNHEGITISKMNSVTPKMEFGIEYDTTITDGTKDRVEFIVKNIDFGIVERARQQLDVSKRVSAFKVVLSNGQTIADATVDENGNLQGNHNYVTYMAPSTINGIINRGFIKAELDDEILEGSTLDVVYEIKYTNNSEIDYMSENYYKYGIKEGNIVTLTPSGLVDYLDKNYAFEQDKNTDWKQITVEELEAKKATKVGDTEFLNSRILLYTESTATALEPTKTVSTKLTTSKVLTTSQDLLFNNDVETVTITKPAVPGNQHRGSAVKDFPVDNAEQVLITPSTGEDRNYVLPVTIGIIALVIFAAGVVVIKRYIIKK